MYIGVLGTGGMLGKAVVEACIEKGMVCHGYDREQIDICDANLIVTLNADVVINCAGVIDKANTLGMVKTNALGPHVLATWFSGPIIHVSTDCVFSGIYDDPYPVHFNPDPVDLYGRTKLVGEVKADHVLNVRTSFIGFDHGFLRWLIDNRNGQIEGWANAMWSGSTVYAVARGLVDMAVNFKNGGIAHLATLKGVDKCMLAFGLGNLLDLHLSITRSMMPVIDRTLEPTHILPDVSEVSDELRSKFVAAGLHERHVNVGN